MTSGGSRHRLFPTGIWAQLPTVWRAALTALAVIALAGWLATMVTRDATFSISARSEVLVLDVGCTRPLVWDLPPGRIQAAGNPAGPASKPVTAEMRGGARVRVALDAERRWLIEFERSDLLGCGPPAPDAIVFSIEGEPWPVTADRYRYRSDRPITEGRQPPWLLGGRVVIGEEIQFGTGRQDASASPMLASARIDVRTPDAQTAQRRQIHEEQVDAGGIVDSHGCLDALQDRLADCVRRARSAAEGFVHVSGDHGSPGFDVQLLVAGERIGIRQQAGAERRIVVTWWSKVITSSWAQITAVLLTTLGGVTGLWGFIGERRSDGEEQAE